MNERLSGLPSEPADRLSALFERFLRIEAMAGIVLLLSTFLALILANTSWSSAYSSLWETSVGIHIGSLELVKSLKHWINDGLMTLFFFVIALELKREFMLGELRDPRVAALPIAAAIGGMVTPAAVFLLIVGSGPGASGWGTVMSTDTAFLMGCLSVLGARVPLNLRVFLLSLAIFDDVGAILIVAIGYGDDLNFIALGAATVGLLTIVTMTRLGVRSLFVYFVSGSAIWLAIDASGIHATLVGVVLGLMAPARSWVSDSRLHTILDRVIAYPPGDHWSKDAAARADLHSASVATREALSPIEQLEIALHPWVAFAILPLFALANAGVPIANTNFDPTLTAAIIAAFVAGKPLGVILFALVVVKSRIGHRPDDLSWRLLAAGGLLTGIGFTMALFIADLAFDAELRDSVKLGILGASVISAALGMIFLSWITSLRAAP